MRRSHGVKRCSFIYLSTSLGGLLIPTFMFNISSNSFTFLRSSINLQAQISLLSSLNSLVYLFYYGYFSMKCSTLICPLGSTFNFGFLYSLKSSINHIGISNVEFNEFDFILLVTVVKIFLFFNILISYSFLI